MDLLFVLPALPNISRAKFPAIYEQARAVLTNCSKIDECRKWAKKADALASYAKQAEDKTLMELCVRVKARAIRRCGELLREMTPQAKAGQPKKNGGGGPTISESARKAGLSRDQKVQALRVANVPQDEFERAVESANPPTVTELAQRGTQAQPGPRLQEG